MKRQSKSIILSVSLGRDCYRHIEVPDEASLEELAGIILDAFAFDNDHAHAFFLDNRAWSDAACYYMAEVDEDGEFPHTCDCLLYQLLLKKGDAFKFLFDFGDEWVFQCKVLRVESPGAAQARVIRAVGEAPEQYPDYRDDGAFDS